jgi:hypothetical protein
MQEAPVQGAAARPLPTWIEHLDDEDLQFVRRLVLASGSLKSLALEYGVSYPTIRGRLDRLIAKVDAIERFSKDGPLERKLRLLVADNRISPGLAREILDASRAEEKGRNS